MTLRICIALHDVAPGTWPRCQQLLDLIDAFGQPPVTLLVVPNYHAQGRIEAGSAFVQALQHRLDRGDEVALHGYFHRDDSPAPRSPAAWLRRRVLTAGEGEFSALTGADASRRIRRGWEELSRLFPPIRGFIAPAWLYADSVWDALLDSPLQYCATRHSLVVLDGLRHVAAPAITVSSRSRWRRAASSCWLSAFSQLNVSASLLRVALHPGDAEYPSVIENWRRLLARLLAHREPVTKSRVLGLA